MEKKKLLLVAVSVGVFLVIVLGAAILVFSPKNAVSAVDTTALSALSGRIPASSETGADLPNQPASMDPSDLVRNPNSIQGLQTPPVLLQDENNYFVNNENQRQPLIFTEPAPGRPNSGSNTVISVPQPSIAVIPEVPPAASPNTPAQAAPPAQSAPAAQSAPVVQAAPAARTSVPAAPRPKPSTPAARSSPASSGKAAKPTVQTPADRNNYWVQTGSFSTKTRAEGAKDMLAAKGITPIIENRDVNGKTFFRVRVGPYTSRNEADYWLTLIKNINGFENSQIWISQSRL